MIKVKLCELTPEEIKSLRQLRRLEARLLLLTIECDTFKKVWWEEVISNHTLPMNWQKVKWIEGKTVYAFE